ncbi:Uncharacterised protein [Vibrio cholerae]|nr:Uncharacterised protein [Vibrio cholerae]CSD46121.1 Uncharacterised protein [Vibrio cholerae]
MIKQVVHRSFNRCGIGECVSHASIDKGVAWRDEIIVRCPTLRLHLLTTIVEVSPAIEAICGLPAQVGIEQMFR